MKIFSKRWQHLVIFCLMTLLCSPVASGQQLSPAESQDMRQKLFLSVDEAINLALQNNLDISIEQYNPEIKKEEIRNAESAFDSSTSADLNQTFNESESSTTPTGISKLDLGIGKRFTSGGSYQFGFSSGVNTFDGTTTSIELDPETGSPAEIETDLENSYENSLTLTLNQPMLKDFGAEVNMTAIHTARKNRDISVSQLRSKIIDVVSQVKKAYWDVVNAAADLEAKKLSLQLANDLVKINEAQVNVGTLAPIEVLQAKAQAASRGVDVTTAELAVLNAEDQLKKLLNFTEDDPVWGAALILTDAPGEEHYSITLEEGIEAALAYQESLKQLQQTIEIKELSTNYAENQLLPDLKLLGTLGTSGTNTGWGDSIGDMGSFKEFEVTVGANLSYPLGNRSAQSEYNKAKLELEQAKLSLRNTEQQIIVQVRVAHRRVATAYDLIGATRIARELAEEQLDAEQKKFNEGLSTNFQVLDYQDKLTKARTAESAAISAYNQELVDLEQAIGITLQKHHIVIKDYTE